MIQLSLFIAGLLFIGAAAVVEARRPDDPRISHLQQVLADQKAENVKLIEMAIARQTLITKLKGYLDQIIVAQRAGVPPPSQPHAE